MFARLYTTDNAKQYVWDLNANIEGLEHIILDYKNNKITKKQFIWETQYIFLSIGMFSEMLKIKNNNKLKQILDLI